MDALDLFRGNLRPTGLANQWNRFMRDFDSFFQDFDRRMEPSRSGLIEWQPSYEIKEYDQSYQVNLDIPGMKKEDIQVEVQGRRLMVSGERKVETRDEDVHYLVERQYGKYQQVFTLPEGVNIDEIDANYQDGVLYLTIPKSEKALAKKIKIGEGSPSLLRRVIGKKEEKAEDKKAQA